MDEFDGIPVKTMTLTDWILLQEDGCEFKLQHVREGNLCLTGLINKTTKELYIVAERKDIQ